MLNIKNLLAHSTIQKLDQELETVFTNAPHLPSKVTEILVKIAPYMLLVSGLFMVTGGLQSIFGANSLNRILDLWRNIPPLYFYLIGSLQILAGVLSISAFQALKAKALEGWQTMLVLTFLSLLMNLISVGFFREGLFGLLLSLLLGLYILYELKPAYLPGKIKINENTKSKK